MNIANLQIRVVSVSLCVCMCDCPLCCCSGTASAAVFKKASCPLRRTNSAPELSHVLTASTRSSSSSDIEGPPPELLERRRGSLQGYNDVFLRYVPYITGAIPPAAAVVHLALNIAQRLSSS